MVIYYNPKTQTEISLTCQLTSWMGRITPICLDWWYTDTNLSVTLSILCFSLNFDFWWLNDNKS